RPSPAATPAARAPPPCARAPRPPVSWAASPCPRPAAAAPPAEDRRMCLGVPGRVTETFHEHDVLMGKVEFGGVLKRVCLEHVPDVRPGEYVLVHVGFALSRIDEAEAARVFALLGELNQLGELEEPPP